MTLYMTLRQFMDMCDNDDSHMIVSDKDNDIIIDGTINEIRQDILCIYKVEDYVELFQKEVISFFVDFYKDVLHVRVY